MPAHSLEIRRKIKNFKQRRGFSRRREIFLKLMISFESRLKGLDYDIALNPVR